MELEAAAGKLRTQDRGLICANLVDVVNDVNNDVASVTPDPCQTRKGGANRLLTNDRA